MMMLLFQLLVGGCATEEECSDDTTCGFGEVCVSGGLVFAIAAQTVVSVKWKSTARKAIVQQVARRMKIAIPVTICNVETSSCEGRVLHRFSCGLCLSRVLQLDYG